MLTRLIRYLFGRPVEYRCAPPVKSPHLLALHVGEATFSRSALR